MSLIESLNQLRRGHALERAYLLQYQSDELQGLINHCFQEIERLKMNHSKQIQSVSERHLLEESMIIDKARTIDQSNSNPPDQPEVCQNTLFPFNETGKDDNEDVPNRPRFYLHSESESEEEEVNIPWINGRRIWSDSPIDYRFNSINDDDEEKQIEVIDLTKEESYRQLVYIGNDDDYDDYDNDYFEYDD